MALSTEAWFFQQSITQLTVLLWRRSPYGESVWQGRRARIKVTREGVIWFSGQRRIS